jgi:hypothetical protein
MNTNTALSLQCQLLCACGASYNVVGGNYAPSKNDPFGPAIGWSVNMPNTPVAIAGGSENINVALVGMVNLNLSGTLTNSIVIAFRGTLPPYPITLPGLIDWYNDFLDSPTTTPNVPGQVHSGFLSDLNTIIAGVQNAVNNLQTLYPAAPIYVTGHSKGGALASIFAAVSYFNPTNSLQVNGVITFASACAGNSTFVSNFPQSIITVRYENYLDIVPFFPPSQVLVNALVANPSIDGAILLALVDEFADGGNWGYTPLGTLFFIDQNGHTTQQSTNPCLNTIAQTIGQGIIGLKLIAAAHSHLCGGGYMGGTCPTGVCSVNS